MTRVEEIQTRREIIKAMEKDNKLLEKQLNELPEEEAMQMALDLLVEAGICTKRGGFTKRFKE